MAMVLSEAGADAGRQDIRVLASDIDPVILGLARAAEFNDIQMAGVSTARRQRFFEASASGLQRARQSLLEMISFRELNLLSPWPMKSAFDVIFCRNVVIYFDEDTQSRLWPRFRAALKPFGVLCLGHSERIAAPASMGFESWGVTTYRAVAEDRSKAGRGTDASLPQ
jgi:chemotaxis protein methyltransferase CheR